MTNGRRDAGPHWYWIPLRVVLVALLLMMLAFALSLLLGIIGTAVAAVVRGAHIDVTFAYRYVAPPVAVLVGAAGLILGTWIEVRYYRQAKMPLGTGRAS